jgi:hypothetical protein
MYTTRINQLTRPAVRTKYLIRVCGRHRQQLAKLIPQYTGGQTPSPEFFRIPHVVDERKANCLRCGGVWHRKYWRLFGTPNYGKIPPSARCASPGTG